MAAATGQDRHWLIRGGGLALAAVFVALALALKATTFGDLSRSADESFYFLVGQRMHEGLLPYVDVWDRKPLGLFLIYYAIAGISSSVWCYQIIACLFAATTALLISAIVTRWAGLRGGVLAGIAYLFILGPFEGNSGQSPDFYNPFIAGAVLLIVSEFENLDRGVVRWPIWAAMALCGLALTIKQTALFEAIFLGLWIAGSLLRAGVPPRRLAAIVAGCCALGALPTLSIAAYYWQQGYWHEFWHAMVTSNLVKARPGGEAWRLVGIVLRALVLIGFAIWGLVGHRFDRRARLFLAGWLGAALLGFLSVPNFFGHYTLPVLVPLCVCAGLLAGRSRNWLALIVGFVLYAALWSNLLAGERTRKTNAAMERVARDIRLHDSGGGLLVFDGPSYLYAMTGERFLSPLVFPHHLADGIENNVSHLDTHAEIDRILANRPGVIVMARHPLITPINLYSRARVKAYAQANCSIIEIVEIPTDGHVPFVIFGDCRQTAKRAPGQLLITSGARARLIGNWPNGTTRGSMG